MSSRIKGLFSSKKKKEEKEHAKAQQGLVKGVSSSAASIRTANSSFSASLNLSHGSGSQKTKAMSVTSLTSSTSVHDLQKDVTLTGSTKDEPSFGHLPTPSPSASHIKSSVTQPPTTMSQSMVESPVVDSTIIAPTATKLAGDQDSSRGIAPEVVEELSIATSTTTTTTTTTRRDHPEGAELSPKTPAPETIQPTNTYSAETATHQAADGPSPETDPHTATHGDVTLSVPAITSAAQAAAQPTAVTAAGVDVTQVIQGSPPSSANSESARVQHLVPVDRDMIHYTIQPDGSFVEQPSHVSQSMAEAGEEEGQYVQEGYYLTSTTEFFPVDDQDERVYLDQFSEVESDEIPELQFKVTKLQKQVREMRRFMRGMVQLQVEQYEPATILIQAWWRGCLVRRELRKQRVFSWHRNPSKTIENFTYLTRAELIKSCSRISVPRASILVSEAFGANKEMMATIKLQAFFRGCLVRRRVHAYWDGMQAATIIQATWRGYYARNLDTRLGVEQLRFRNVKVQKAFGKMLMKIQYLQTRVLALVESNGPMQETQDQMQKEIENMGDQLDAMKQDLEQGFKILDEQMAEEKEQTTIELRTLTDRIQKMEEDLATIRKSNTSLEKQVQSLTSEESFGARGNDQGEDDEDEDEDYEVQYDEDGNRIEKKPKMIRPVSSRRTSHAHPESANDEGSPVQLVESPIPMQQPHHRGSISSVHSQPRPHSMTSQPSSPTQGFPRSFPASYSPTTATAPAVSEGANMFTNGMRPHSMAFVGPNGVNTGNHTATRSMTIDPSQLYRFHAAANQHIPISPSTGGPAAASAAAPVVPDPKKYVSIDDFEYMQAEVDTLRLNNDRLEGMVRELTMRLNNLTGGGGPNMGQFYPG